MIDLYTWATPNGFKVSIMLEECGLPYAVKPVDITAGEQHGTEFRRVNPNGKIPAIVDRDAGLTVFESMAILVYLAEKTGRFLPRAGQARFETLQWASWQMGGVGPMFGQASFFIRKAPENGAAIERYVRESRRLLDVADLRLETRRFFAGDDYSIADMMIYPWMAVARTFLETSEDPWSRRGGLMRWLGEIGERDAVKTGMEVPFPHRPPATGRQQ